MINTHLPWKPHLESRPVRLKTKPAGGCERKGSLHKHFNANHVPQYEEPREALQQRRKENPALLILGVIMNRE